MKKITRRDFLKVAGISAAAMGLVACGGGGNNGGGNAGGGNAGGGNAGGGNEGGSTGGASDMKVAMITDYGDITDQSFNQTTYEACQAWCNANGVDFTYKKPSGDSTAERVSMIDSAIDEGYNVIVMPGYAFGEAIQEEVPVYPDVKFVGLDVSEFDLGDLASDIPSNLYCAIYQEELAGYMAGYAVVKMGYRKLAFLGGMAVPAVIRYGYGFVQGADAAAAEDGATSAVSVDYYYGNQFYGDADITAAMDTCYASGVELVFACGGGIFTSAGEAAAKVGGKVVGVDVDQAPTIDGAYGAGMTVTSAMKGLAPTVNTILTAINAGQWGSYGGKVDNLGLVSGTDVESNYVQIPMGTTVWGDGFSQDDYKKLVADMYSGAVTVSNDTSASPDSIPGVSVKVVDHGNIK